jgi:hypothetical protein
VLKDYGNYPSAPALRCSVTYLETVISRIDAQKQQITEPLGRLLRDPLMSDIWVVEVASGGKNRVYYLKDKPELDPNDAPEGANYIGGFDMAEKRIPGGLRMSALIRNEAAPQKRLAKELQSQLQQLNSTGWEQAFCKMLQSIEADNQIDPILKFNLFKQTLDVACRGSHVLDDALQADLSAVKSAEIDSTANWLDPTDLPARRNREKVAEFFAALPDLGAAGKTVARDLAELNTPIGVPLRPVGWLCRDRSGSWHCRFDRSQNDVGELVVVVKQTGGATAFVSLGRRKSLTGDFAPSDNPALREGRLVYLKQP